MIAQLKAAAGKPDVSATALAGTAAAQLAQPVAKASFSDLLKASLDSVDGAQQKSEAMGKSFALGDDKVNLSDVMISMQKASISFQASVQVRNKLVSAYHEIMNMQV